jgi:hypothetical protein
MIRAFTENTFLDDEFGNLVHEDSPTLFYCTPLQVLICRVSATVQNRISRLFKTGQFVRC